MRTRPPHCPPAPHHPAALYMGYRPTGFASLPARSRSSRAKQLGTLAPNSVPEAQISHSVTARNAPRSHPTPSSHGRPPQGAPDRPRRQPRFSPKACRRDVFVLPLLVLEGCSGGNLVHRLL